MNNKYRETPLFFRNGSYNLFGVLHAPLEEKGQIQERKTGIVFCHAFAEEKLIAHRTMVSLARSLSEKGIWCLRFDHMGHGDSDGNSEDATVETMLSDIKRAVGFMRENVDINQIGLLGLRFGGTLAAMTCQNHTHGDFLIMISPITDGRVYIEQCLRSNLTMQLATYGKILKDRAELIGELLDGRPVNIDGYLIGPELYRQFNDVNLMNHQMIGSDRILLIQIAKKEQQPFDKNLEQVIKQWKVAGKNAVLVNTVEDQFWKDAKRYAPKKMNLERVIVEWCGRVLAS